MKSLAFYVFPSLLAVSFATYSYPQPWSSPVVVGPAYGHSQYGYTYEVPCNNIITNEIVLSFQQALYECITTLFHKVVALSDAHFTFSPYTIWKSLAAIAEGSEGQTRDELFRFLGLPEDKCIRQMFYRLVSNRETLSHDVVLQRKQLLIADSSVIINRVWENYIKTHRLIDVAQASYKSNPLAEIENWRQTFNAQLPNPNLNGNSIILESLDYHGLWTSAFTDATIVQEPFYNAFGEQVASIEYMRMRKRVSMAYLPHLNMKIMELPVGKDSRYIMLFALVINKSASRSTLDIIKSSAIFEALSNMKKSQVPIEVTLPRLTMTSEIDVRKVLEEVGITGLWTDPYATRNISEPAALPSSYIQRVTVTLDNTGASPTIQEYSNFIPAVPCEATPYSDSLTGLDPALGQDFTGNRPFLFGLFDTETFTCLFASSFSKPTY